LVHAVDHIGQEREKGRQPEITYGLRARSVLWALRSACSEPWANAQLHPTTLHHVHQHRGTGILKFVIFESKTSEDFLFNSYRLSSFTLGDGQRMAQSKSLGIISYIAAAALSWRSRNEWNGPGQTRPVLGTRRLRNQKVQKDSRAAFYEGVTRRE